MKIGIIGAGKLGCAFALGLDKKGTEVSGVYNRSIESEELLGTKLNKGFDNNLAQTVKNSEVILITVPDSEIENVSNEVSQKLEHLDICWKTFLHCSGALTSEVLNPIRQQGAYTGSLHPIQTFADKENGWRGLDNIYFGFEGCDEAKKRAEELIKLFSGHLLDVKKEDKPVYHAAACILSNYMVTLSGIAGSLFDKIGIDSRTGISAFMPLMEKTVKNIELLGSCNALTGPISRGDCSVVSGHVTALKEKSSEAVEVYKTMGRATVEFALGKGRITAENAGKLYNILK